LFFLRAISATPRLRVEKRPEILLNPADKPDMEISSIALSSMQNVQDRFDRAADGVARAPANPQDSVDLSAQAVDMISAKNQFAFGVKIVHVGDELQQSLLNLLA
jgi:hypothetical protein